MALTEDLQLEFELTAPTVDIIQKDFKFTPTDVVVDNKGTIFVSSSGSFMGLLMYDYSGNFLGFYGSNEIVRSYSAVMEYFWRRIMTAVQRKKNKRFVPIEISGMDIDTDGFVYTTTTKATSNALKKLNALGINVMESTDGANTRYGTPVYGDFHEYNDPLTGRRAAVSLIDVEVDEDQFISVLDSTTGRVFVYDPQSILVGVFGGIGFQEGTFRQPISMESINDSLLVLDRQKGIITQFLPNDYGREVRAALILYYQGKYQESLDLWKGIQAKNANMETAYICIGKAYYQIGDYKQAMENFKLGNAKAFYSEAFAEYRKEITDKYFPFIFAGMAVMTIALLGLLIKKPKPSRDRHVLSKYYQNPLRLFQLALIKPGAAGAFLKQSAIKRRGVYFSLVVLFVWFYMQILKNRFIGFAFNYNNLQEFRVLNIVFTTVMVFVLWVVVNWAVTTLLSGKGSVAEIWVASSFALLPLIFADVSILILSNLISLHESMWITILQNFSILWALFILVCACKEIQEYSVARFIFTSLIALLGMGAVIFLLLVIQTLVQQLVSFFKTIYKELVIRS